MNVVCMRMRNGFSVGHTSDLNMIYQGCLGGSVSWTSDVGSGRDLTVPEFEPRVGLCADGSEPGAALDSVSPSLSAPPPLMLCLSRVNKQKKLNIVYWAKN